MWSLPSVSRMMSWRQELRHALLVFQTSGQRATLEWLAGYALVRSRAPFAETKPHFEASAEAADAAHAQYELARIATKARSDRGARRSSRDAPLRARPGRHAARARGRAAPAPWD